MSQSIGREAFTRANLYHDLIAGLTVAVMIIPQGMAYGLLAGFPPIYGLYAAFIPLLIYPFFGSSKQLSVGPVALVSIIVLAGVSQWAEPGSTRYIELALLTSFVAGVIQIGLAMVKMGFLVNFLSEPVISGFTTAAAMIIAFSQVKYLLGVEFSASNTVMDLLQGIAVHLPETNWIALGIGVSAIVFIMVMKAYYRKFPSALIVVVIGTLLVYLFQLNQSGIPIVGDVPKGLPAIATSFIDWSDIVLVTPLALVICLISFIESLAIARTIVTKRDLEPINANRELFGLGLAKFIGSFFQAFPNTGSFTRSAINDEAGAKTGMSSIFAGLIVGLILMFLTPLFYYLPKAVLGAVVISAVFGLINLKFARYLFIQDKKDFVTFLVTCLLTLFFGIMEGVITGIILSLLLIVRRAAKPHFALLGKLPGTNVYRNIQRYPEAEVPGGIAIVRYDESIYFANAQHFYDTILESIQSQDKIHTIVLNCTAINNIDTTGLRKLNELLDHLEGRGIQLLFTDIRGPIRDLFVRSGLIDKIGFSNNYLNTHHAVVGHVKKNGESDLSRQYASQRNKRKARK